MQCREAVVVAATTARQDGLNEVQTVQAISHAIDVALPASYETTPIECPACGDEGNPDSLSHLCPSCDGGRSVHSDSSSSALTKTVPPGLTLREFVDREGLNIRDFDVSDNQSSTNQAEALA